jgi:hypothetical protein
METVGFPSCSPVGWWMGCNACCSTEAFEAWYLGPTTKLISASGAVSRIRLRVLQKKYSALQKKGRVQEVRWLRMQTVHLSHVSRRHVRNCADASWYSKNIKSIAKL